MFDLGWSLMEAGARDRRHAFHTPMLATVADGRPDLRMVVLRAADRVTGTLRFHTDRRSPKAAAMLAAPAVVLGFYDPVARVQVRASGHAQLHHDDALADAAWAGSQRMSRVCYGSSRPPTAEIAAADNYALPETDVEIAAGRAAFCAVVVTVDSLDVLTLAAARHRRARVHAAGGVWLAP